MAVGGRVRGDRYVFEHGRERVFLLL